MEKNMDKIYSSVIQCGMGVLAAILIFVIGRWVAQFVSKFLESTMIKAKVNKTLALFTRHLIFYGMMTLIAIAALNKIGIETGSFIAVVGAASLAIGLALQGTLSNFASGVLLILFQPFKVGEMVDAGGAKGRVEEIQIFNTVLISDSNQRVIVPNSKITSDKITIEPA